MDWYNSTIYWTNRSGHINWFDQNNRSLSVMTMPSTPVHAEALAFDWLGQYLYWSCNTNQVCFYITLCLNMHVEDKIEPAKTYELIMEQLIYLIRYVEGLHLVRQLRYFSKQTRRFSVWSSIH